jgi:hypothetical protein
LWHRKDIGELPVHVGDKEAGRSTLESDMRKALADKTKKSETCGTVN